MFAACLVIVAYFDIERVAIHRPKTNTPLLANGNSVLPLSVILERVQPIPWRYASRDKRQHDRRRVRRGPHPIHFFRNSFRRSQITLL